MLAGLYQSKLVLKGGGLACLYFESVSPIDGWILLRFYLLFETCETYVCPAPWAAYMKVPFSKQEPPTLAVRK